MLPNQRVAVQPPATSWSRLLLQHSALLLRHGTHVCVSVRASNPRVPWPCWERPVSSWPYAWQHRLIGTGHNGLCLPYRPPTTTDPALHVKTISLVLRTESATDNTLSAFSLSLSLFSLSRSEGVLGFLLYVLYLVSPFSCPFGVHFALRLLPARRMGILRAKGWEQVPPSILILFFFFSFCGARKQRWIRL